MNFKSLVLESIERRLLLEYDHDKEWEKHGPAILNAVKEDYLDVGLTDLVKKINEPASESQYKRGIKEYLKKTDPTPTQNYHGWIIKTFAKGGFGTGSRRHEDMVSRGHQALSDYDHHKKRNPKIFDQAGVPKDIGQIKNLWDLEKHVSKLNSIKDPREEEHKKNKPGPDEYTELDSEHFRHIIPHTEKASKYYGRGTKWCTAARDNCMFDYYNQKGALHIMIPKHANYPGEKYQYHADTKQFMDKDDNPIEESNYSVHPHVEEHVNNVALDQVKSMDEAGYGKDHSDHWHPHVREMTARFNKDPNVIRKLSKDKDYNVSKAAIRRLPLNERLQHLNNLDVKDNSQRAKLISILNSHPTGHEIFEHFQDHPSWAVQDTVADRLRNPETLKKMYKRAALDNLHNGRDKNPIHGYTYSGDVAKSALNSLEILGFDRKKIREEAGEGLGH